MTHPTAVHNPIILWAQRPEQLFLTFEVFSPSDISVTASAEKLFFSCNSPNGKYEKELEFYEPVDSTNIKQTDTGQGILVTIAKSKDSSFWPRLTKSAAKDTHIRTDFSRWIDEDEWNEHEHEGPEGLGGDMDFSQYMPTDDD